MQNVLIAGTALAMALTAETAAASGGVIAVGCDGVDPATQIKICEFLEASIGEMRPSAIIVSAPESTAKTSLDLQFTLLRKGADFAIGQLSWSTADGRSSTGPTIEIAVMDSSLRDSSLKQFVTALIQSVDIPDAP